MASPPNVRRRGSSGDKLHLHSLSRGKSSRYHSGSSKRRLYRSTSSVAGPAHTLEPSLAAAERRRGSLLWFANPVDGGIAAAGRMSLAWRRSVAPIDDKKDVNDVRLTLPWGAKVKIRFTTLGYHTISWAQRIRSEEGDTWLEPGELNLYKYPSVAFEDAKRWQPLSDAEMAILDAVVSAIAHMPKVMCQYRRDHVRPVPRSDRAQKRVWRMRRRSAPSQWMRRCATSTRRTRRALSRCTRCSSPTPRRPYRCASTSYGTRRSGRSTRTRRATSPVRTASTCLRCSFGKTSCASSSIPSLSRSRVRRCCECSPRR